jgi:hypothetical protein
MNNKTEFSQILEECIHQILNGAAVEEVLEKFPNHSKELRPLLVIAKTTMLNYPSESIPSTVVDRSRTTLLSRAKEITQGKSTPRKQMPFFTLAFRYTALIVVALSLFVYSGLASANSLPGELLYPVKINLERFGQVFVSDVSTRIGTEIKIENRRAIEVEDLLASGRTEDVEFGGFLVFDESQSVPIWTVNQIKLVFPSIFNADLEAFAGSDVVVDGTTQDQGVVLVESLTQHLFYLEGTIEQIYADSWQVDGWIVSITPQTQVIGVPIIGSEVEITSILYPESKWIALTATMEDADENGRPILLPKPSATIDSTESDDTIDDTGGHTDDNLDSDSDDSDSEEKDTNSHYTDDDINENVEDSDVIK